MSRALAWLCHTGGIAVHTLQRMEHATPRLISMHTELEAKLQELTSGLDALTTFDVQDWQRALTPHTTAPVDTSPGAEMTPPAFTTALGSDSVRRLPHTPTERPSFTLARDDVAASAEARVVPLRRRVPKSVQALEHRGRAATAPAKSRSRAPGSVAVGGDPTQPPRAIVPWAHPAKKTKRPARPHAEVADAASERWSIAAARTPVVFAEPERRVQELLRRATFDPVQSAADVASAPPSKGPRLRGVERLAALSESALNQPVNSPPTYSLRPSAGSSHAQPTPRSTQHWGSLPLPTPAAPASELRGLAGLARRFEFTPAAEIVARTGERGAQQTPALELDASSLSSEMEARAKLETRMGEVLRRQAERQGIDLQRGRG